MWCLKLARVRCAKTSDVSQDMQSIAPAPVVATYDISVSPTSARPHRGDTRAETVRPCCKCLRLCVHFGHGNDRSQQLHVTEPPCSADGGSSSSPSVYQDIIEQLDFMWCSFLLLLSGRNQQSHMCCSWRYASTLCGYLNVCTIALLLWFGVCCGCVCVRHCRCCWYFLDAVRNCIRGSCSS